MNHYVKIVAVAIILLGVYLGFGAIMNWQIEHMGQLVHKIQEIPLAVTRSILTASRDSIAISRNAKDLLLSTDSDHRRARLAEIDAYELNIKKNMERVYERVDTDEARELTKDAMKLLEQQVALRERLVEKVLSGKHEDAALLAQNEGTLLMKKIEEAMRKIVHYAESQSIAYQIESNDQMRKSRVVLFSAGIMVVLLSLIFALAVEAPLLHSLRKTSEKIHASTESPIDLTAKFPVPTTAKINHELNAFYEKVARHINAIKEQSAFLSQELSRVSKAEHIQPVFFDNLAAKLQPLLERIGIFSAQSEHSNHNFHVMINLLTEVQGDFLLMSQMMSGEELLIDDILLTSKSLNDKEKSRLETLKVYKKSLRNHIDRSNKTIDAVNKLLSKFMDATNNLVAVAPHDLPSDIERLKQEFARTDQRLAELRTAANALLESFREFKLVENEVKKDEA